MLPLIGAGIGLIGGIGKIFARSKANKDLKNLMKQDPVYAANPLAAEQLGIARNLLNARMPGAATVERNIYGQGGNAMASVGRNATDASQALALGAAINAQTQRGLMDLGVTEAQDYQRRYGNLTDAMGRQINEEDKVFADRESNYANKVAMQGKINENRQAAWGDIANMGFGLANFGLAGGGEMASQALGGLFQGRLPGPGLQGPQINQFGLQQALGNLPGTQSSPFAGGQMPGGYMPITYGMPRIGPR